MITNISKTQQLNNCSELENNTVSSVHYIVNKFRYIPNKSLMSFSIESKQIQLLSCNIVLLNEK